jgi:hypothetical protein
MDHRGCDLAEFRDEALSEIDPVLQTTPCHSCAAPGRLKNLLTLATAGTAHGNIAGNCWYRRRVWRSALMRS